MRRASRILAHSASPVKPLRRLAVNRGWSRPVAGTAFPADVVEALPQSFERYRVLPGQGVIENWALVRRIFAPPNDAKNPARFG
jgi:hypothetical protein